MNLTYKLLYSVLAKQYSLKQRNGQYCFTDNDNNVVAIIDDNKIVMYYHVSSNIIWNHKNTVAIAFVKDLNVNGKLCDIISVFGLCGSVNDVTIIGNFGLEKSCNTAIFASAEQDCEFKNGFGFEEYSVENDGISNIFRRCIFDELKESFGSCGRLEVVDNQVNLNICESIYINNLTKSEDGLDGLDINIINRKSDVTTNYDEVYGYYRNLNDWYYGSGYKCINADKIRQFTEDKWHSTFAENKIHLGAEVIIFAKKIIR